MTGPQFLRKRSNQVLEAADMRERLAKGCANVVRSKHVAAGDVVSMRDESRSEWLPAESPSIKSKKIWGYGGSEQIDNFELNGPPQASEVLCPEEGWETPMQYKNGKLCGQKQGENTGSADSNSDPAVEKRPEAGHISSPPDGDMSEQWLLPVAEGFATRKNAKIQAKCVNVKCWACVNFSCLRGEELLRFLRSLVRMCVNIGMDFSVEPTMLMHDPCPTDIEDSLLNVQMFFDHHETETGRTRFLLVILPDGVGAHEGIEDFFEDIGVVYQCCLPLYDDNRMVKKKYLKNAANGIKAKVMDCNRLSDSHKDLNRDEMAEYYGYNYEEMGEDGYNYKEMGEDDGYNYKEMEAVQLCSSHNESGEYTYEEKNHKASHIGGTPDREESEQQLLPDEGFIAITDVIPQAKSANTKPWVCLNFSRISGEESFRFLSKLQNVCMSIGMDLSPEPTMMFHISTSSESDVSATLWTVFKFFQHLDIGKGETIVLVILPEARYSHVDVEHMCENLGLVCQFCSPLHVRRASEKYLKNAANKMKSKVLQYNTPFESCSGRSDSDPEEFYGSDEETGEDGSQQSEYSDAEMGIQLQLCSSRKSGEAMSEKLASSDKQSNISGLSVAENGQDKAP